MDKLPIEEQKEIMERSKNIVDQISRISDEVLASKYSKDQVQHLIDIFQNYHDIYAPFNIALCDDGVNEVIDKMNQMSATFIEFLKKYQDYREWR